MQAKKVPKNGKKQGFWGKMVEMQSA